MNIQIQEETAPDPTAVLRSTKVEKPLDLEYDLGNLLASDPNELSLRDIKSKGRDKYLKSLARDNTQLLFTQIWNLQFERVDDVVITKLPKPTYLIPREKHLPKGNQLTKWETYAKEKGISKKKKTKLVWDEIVKGWVPRYGYRKAEAEHEKDWVLEVPGNADPFEDQFSKKTEAKSERIAKNELQRLKNIARYRKVDVPSTGLIPTERPSKTELHQAMHVAKKATASLGKFQAKLPNEKPLKGTGKKRKFEPIVQETGKEKSMNLDVLDKIIHKKPLLNMEKVVSRRIPKNINEVKERYQDTQDDDGDDDSSRRGRRGKGKGGAGGDGAFRKSSSKQKRGSVRKGGLKKGRAAPKSKPKRKTH